MLRPLPFSAADQLVRIYSTEKWHSHQRDLARPAGRRLLDMRDFAQNSHSSRRWFAYDAWRKNVSFGKFREPEQMRVGLVPSTYFEVLEIQPILGACLRMKRITKGKTMWLAISARMWRERFAGDKAIIGQEDRIMTSCNHRGRQCQM